MSDGPVEPFVFDLRSVEMGGADGVVWSLPDSGDLNVNLVKPSPSSGVEPHVNEEVDVVVYMVLGSGTLEVDGRVSPLGHGDVAHIPKGARRQLSAGAEGAVYLSVHRARRGLGITG